MENIYVVIDILSNEEEIYSLDRHITLRGVFSSLENAKNALEQLVEAALEEYSDAGHFPATEPDHEGVVYQEIYGYEMFRGEINIYSIPLDKITDFLVEHALYIE